jgi:hypothetical protein
MDNKTKTCNGCKQTLPVSKFSKRLNGYQHLCKPCQSVYQKNYVRKRNPEARAAANRKWRLIKIFGITPDDYQKMLESQNHACAVCRQPEIQIHHATKKQLPLSVDHCHKTGKVRQLLCNRCNTTLGKVDDDGDLLRALAEYVEKHSATLSQGD